MPLSGSILTDVQNDSFLFDAKLSARLDLVDRLEHIEVDPGRDNMNVPWRALRSA